MAKCDACRHTLGMDGVAGAPSCNLDLSDVSTKPINRMHNEGATIPATIAQI